MRPFPPESDPLERDEACSCGTEALGRCSDCDRPLCREHGDFFDDDLVCQEHLAERKAKQAGSAVDEYQAAVRAIDTRTRQAIAAFLGAAAEVEPERVFTLSRREVVETKPGKKRAFGRRAPDEVVKSWEEEYATGHNVLGWNYEDTSDPPVRKSQALYVMTTGEMLLRGGYSFVQLTRELATNSRSGHYTRGEGALPGFLAPDQYWHEGPLVPGLPHQIEMLSQTAEWLDQRLADYLAAHPT